MIEEAYCSYEVSKKLKELGFDELCYKFYGFGRDGSITEHTALNRNSYYSGPSAPTHLYIMMENGIMLLIIRLILTTRPLRRGLNIVWNK